MPTRHLVALATTAALLTASFATAAPLPDTSGEAVANALDWLRAQQRPNGCIASPTTGECAPSGSDWAVLAFRAAGVDPGTVRMSPGLPSLVDYVEGEVAHLSDDATSVERKILAAVAADGPAAARDFGGVDLLAELLGLFDGTQFGDPALLNDDYFGLLALGAAGFPGDTEEVVKTREWVFLHQQPNGGWSWGVLTPENPGFVFAIGADVDDTAAAVGALGFTGEQIEFGRGRLRHPGIHGRSFTDAAEQLDKVQTSVAIDRGLLFMKQMQSADGGCLGSYFDILFGAAFGGLSANADSTSWAIMALNLLGQDAEDVPWTTPTGNTLVTFLLSVQQSDGSFQWKPDTPSFLPVETTVFATLALAGGSFVVVP